MIEFETMTYQDLLAGNGFMLPGGDGTIYIKPIPGYVPIGIVGPRRGDATPGNNMQNNTIVIPVENMKINL